jgi:Tol biopolymer transport system component
MNTSLVIKRTISLSAFIVVGGLGIASIIASNGNNGGDLSTLLFTSDRDGNKEIYRMLSDGSSQTRLTNNQSTDSFAKWSSDRKKIVFESRRDGNSEIYIMDSDGGNQANLTNNPAKDGSAVWSPDGTQIAFVSNRDGNENIYIMNADGSGLTQITHHVDSDHQPVWSPDGKRLAFSSGRDSNVWTIWIKDLPSGNLTQITQSPLSTFSPAWSPDGTEIAFITSFSTDPEPPSELRKIKSDGSTTQHTILASNVYNLYGPMWSTIESASVPSRILYVGFTQDIGKSDIYAINADGSNKVNLTQNDHSEGGPVWGPLGYYVAFVSMRHGNPEIYRIKAADGSESIRLTNNSALDISLEWQSSSSSNTGAAGP